MFDELTILRAVLLVALTEAVCIALALAWYL